MSKNPTSLDRTSGTELVITRTFRAASSLMFDAWTKPELVRRWWAPASRGVTMVECEADVREGGSYRYVLEKTKAGRFAYFGQYREVTPAKRLVYTSRFEPVVGKPMPGEAVVTVAFTEHDGETTVVAHEVYPSKEILDGVLSTGMEDGLRETYELLEALVSGQPR